jgi:hypothetical protein
MLHERTPSGVRFVLRRALSLANWRSMYSNPFAPPKAAVADVSELGSAKVGKPVAAWVLQVACALTVPLAVHDSIKSLTSGRADAPFAVLAVLWASFIGLSLLAVRGTQRRANHGRWLGLGFIGLAFAAGASQIWLAQQEARGQLWEPEQRLVCLCAGVFWVLAMARWCWGFAFSKSARAWFSAPRRPRSGEVDDHQR